MIALAAVAVVAVAATVLVVVTSESQAERDRNLLRSAPERLRATQEFALALTLTLTEAYGTERSVTARASFDLADHRTYLRLPEVIGDGDLELLSQDRDLYVSIPDKQQEKMGGIRWARVRRVSLAAASGAGVGPLPDPASILSALDGADRVAGSHNVYEFRTMSEWVARQVDEDHQANAGVLKPLGRLNGLVELDENRLPTVLTLLAVLGDGRTFGAELRVEDVGRELLVGIPPEDAVLDVKDIKAALELVGATTP